MNLTFVSNGQFPDTRAAAIRQSTLAKGLSELGHQVRFLIISPQNWEGQKTIDYFGVTFQELNGYRGTNKILKHYSYFRAIFRARKIVKLQAKQKKIDALVIFSFWPVHILPVYSLVQKARRLNIKVFHEITELPYVVGYKKNELAFYQKKLLPRLDGILVISDKIRDYVNQFNTATQKLLTVVDLSFFETGMQSRYDFPYIGYCGTICNRQNGVPILIEAFSLIREHFPLVKLILVGNNSNKGAIKETLDVITRLGLEEHVIFTGLVDRHLMPVILCNAQLLVAAKPDNEQNSGNFPIKLGEYLATGVPVVVTSVGEIPSYIKDGHTGYLAEPGNAVSFAEKMREALVNPLKAKKVGMNGKAVAQKLFDYKLQSAIMSEYISEIKTPS